MKPPTIVSSVFNMPLSHTNTILVRFCVEILQISPSKSGVSHATDFRFYYYLEVISVDGFFWPRAKHE